MSQQASQAFSDDLAHRMHYVIAVGGHADERCPVLPPDVKRLHWPLADPAQARGSAAEVREVFRSSRDEIDGRVRALLAELGIPAT